MIFAFLLASHLRVSALIFNKQSLIYATVDIIIRQDKENGSKSSYRIYRKRYEATNTHETFTFSWIYVMRRETSIEIDSKIFDCVL